MYRDMFGADHYYLEMQNHGIDIEAKIRAKVVELSARTGIPIVATNDCHYMSPDHTEAQDVLICIQTGKLVTDDKRMHAVAGLHFRTSDEMKQAFADHPQAVLNTLAVAERCNLQLDFGKPLLPAFPLPPGVVDAESHLRELAWEALGTRFPGGVTELLRERFQYELDVICKMGFASYFLIVRDFIHFARSRGIGVGPGRGSVAGSLVAYALHITDIDPIRHQLIFERFLNPERVTMPDIDIDFDDIRRPEVIEYVRQKYGEHNVTQIITFGTMGAKGVLRDVGRVLGLPVAEVDRIAKLVPDGLNVSLERALEQAPDLKALPEKGPVYAKLLRSARVLEGLARHASVHAAGVLITPGPLTDFVPLCRQKGDLVTTQWDMKSVEKAGLLKMDFLGLRTLSVLQECVDLVKLRHGAAPDLATLPEDDAKAFQIFQDAETVAIFQFESTGMRDYLKRLKPTVLEDLTAMNALYRPGPMENIPYFIDCKHGRQKVKYDHPKLESILDGTYGVFVYQEQVMAAAHELAGFSMAQADELRRAMGKKIVEEMARKRAQFIDGCAKTARIPERTADKIFTTMEKFAGYGFNKCLVAETSVVHAQTGERTTVGELFRHRRDFSVHALGDDWKLRPRGVKDVVWNGVRPVFELKTELGHRITTTGNHPFRTLEGWTHLEDLAPGDRIAAPRTLPVRGLAHMPRHEVIALAGLLSEGNTCHPTCLYFFGNDKMIVDDFAAAAGQFEHSVARVYQRVNGAYEVCVSTGQDARFKRGQRPWNAGPTDGNLALDAEITPNRSGMFRWAESLGILGKKATAKFVPGPVFELAQDDLALFLGRLWTGDGFIATGSFFVPFYATSSADLASDVQHLLLRLGITSRIHEKRFAYRGAHRPAYTVHVMGECAVARFEQRIVPHIVSRAAQVELLREHLRAVPEGTTSKDTIPIEVAEWIRADLEPSGSRRRAILAESGVQLSPASLARKRGFRRRTLWRLGQKTGSRRLLELASSDVYWDRVVSIKYMGEQDVYDLEVEGDHNFVAGGLIVHNSHSAAYALVAYQCGWLKANHPAEFMAATMSSEMGDSSRLMTLVEECRRMQIELLPPDVNRSAWKCTIEDGKIRIGLGAVRNVGQGAVEVLLQARAEHGPFATLFDLAEATPPGTLNKRVVESLVAAGACDALGPRERLHAGAGFVLDHASAQHRERASGQSSLFGDADASPGSTIAPPLPEVPAWSSRDRGAREKEVLGFYFSEHPLEHLRADIERVATHGIARALELGDGAEVRIVGLVGEVRQLTTRAGKLMAVVVLEDLTGRVECTLFPDAYEQVREQLKTDAVVIAAGRVEVRDDRGVKLLLQEIKPWEGARQQYQSVLHIEVRAEELTEERILGMDEVLSAYPGESDVVLHIVKPDHSRMAMRSRRFRVTAHDGLIAGLKARVPSCRVRWGKGGG
jgi:DNA polymerase-3 subunit alpha